MVPLLLALAVPFHRLGMRLAVAFPIIGMLLAPLMAAVQADLPVEGIGGDLLAVVIPPAALLAVGLVASKLVGVIRGRLEGVAGSSGRDDRSFRRPPEVGGLRSLCAGPLALRRHRKPKCDIETAIESFTAPRRWGKTNCHLETAVEDSYRPCRWGGYQSRRSR